MPDNAMARPVRDRAGHELAADQGSSSVEVYGADAPASCTVCGLPEEHLSIPYGRCLPCIKAASVVWEAQRARGSVVMPTPTEADDSPVFYQHFWPKPTERAPRPTPRGSVPGRLRGLLRTLNEAPEGRRNTVLHWAACRVAEMVAAGELADPHGAVDALRQVALGTGLEPREVQGTIRSGLSTSGVHL